MARRPGLCWIFAAAVVSCKGEVGPPGAKGEPGDGVASGAGAGEPSLSAILPVSAFLARSLDVTLSGAGTAWTDRVKVSFGEKITLDKLTVASPTALVARVTVAADAVTGPRDIVVSDEESELVYKGAFHVEAPLAVSVTGAPAQGSIFFVRARGLDFSTPFDTTQVGSVFSPTYPNVALVAAPGNGAVLGGVSEYAVDYRVFVDVNAPATAVAVGVLSGTKDEPIAFPCPGAYAVAARAATPLSPGKPTKIALNHPGESALLSYATTDDELKIIDIVSSTTDVSATPAGHFLPQSGRFVDRFAVGSAATFTSNSASTFYAIYADSSAYGGYDLDVLVSETLAQGGVEKEPNDSKNLAMLNGAVVAPWVTQSATLADDSDQDWYALNLDAADVGKSIRAQTSGCDPLTDTVVDIFALQGSSLVPLGPKGAPSDDTGYLDELTSVPVATAGTYFVKVSASSYFDPGHTAYDVIIRLQ
jgi:hypothetical protein